MLSYNTDVVKYTGLYTFAIYMLYVCQYLWLGNYKVKYSLRSSIMCACFSRTGTDSQNYSVLMTVAFLYYITTNSLYTRLPQSLLKAKHKTLNTV